MTAASPSIDFSRYKWRPSPTDPALHIREACGSENLQEVWNRLYNGQQIVFFGVELALHTPVPINEFFKHAREAWLNLRFEVPTVATQVSVDEGGFVMMKYRMASSREDADAWAQRTVRLNTSPDPQSLDDLRYVLRTKLLPEPNGDQAFLYVLPRANDREFGLLLHTCHMTVDGGGVRTMMNRFLACLTECLAGHPAHSQRWGMEVKNLLPSFVEVLGPEELLSGKNYDETMSELLSDVTAGLPRQHTFKPRGVEFGPTLHVSHRFSKSDTDRFLQRSREHGLTINNIANAAVLLITALDNPPTSSTPADAAFAFYGIVDTRSRLAAPYSAHGGYPGLCLGNALIQVPLSILPPTLGRSREGFLSALITVARALKDEYTKLRTRPSLLAVQAQLVDIIHSGIRAGNPPPPLWMGPWYSGDRPSEQYLDATHTDKVGTPILDVQDTYLSINMSEPGPYFRASSWKGELELCIDWNEYANPKDVVQDFMDTWVEMIRAFIA